MTLAFFGFLKKALWSITWMKFPQETSIHVSLISRVNWNISAFQRNFSSKRTLGSNLHWKQAFMHVLLEDELEISALMSADLSCIFFFGLLLTPIDVNANVRTNTFI
jgi:hypothetical protein